MLKIVTDTTCDLPQGWFDQYNITQIPINIQFGLENFKEGISITSDNFYSRINQGNSLPTTSQPSVGEFCELYKSLAADGSHILSIHITSKLSGTWQSAMLAAKQLKDQARVTVFDSLTGSVGLGLMVRDAAQLAQTGLAVDEIVTQLKARSAQINVFIILKDLRYARMSGRVGRLRETMASLLNVKPIVGVENGILIPLERVRGQKKGFERILSLAEELVENSPVHLGIVHAIDQPQADYLLAQAQNRLNCQDTFVTDLALSLAVHFGPGTIGFATYPTQ